jgi:hypothetical protein
MANQLATMAGGGAGPIVRASLEIILEAHGKGLVSAAELKTLTALQVKSDAIFKKIHQADVRHWEQSRIDLLVRIAANPLAYEDSLIQAHPTDLQIYQVQDALKLGWSYFSKAEVIPLVIPILEKAIPIVEALMAEITQGEIQTAKRVGVPFSPSASLRGLQSLLADIPERVKILRLGSHPTSPRDALAEIVDL